MKKARGGRSRRWSALAEVVSAKRRDRTSAALSPFSQCPPGLGPVALCTADPLGSTPGEGS